MRKGVPEVPILTIDVAHPPRPPGVVEEELLQAWNEVRNSSSLRVLKIIHGYGSTGKGGTTKETVRNWLYQHRGKFLGVIEGEEYNAYNGVAQEMMIRIGS